MSYLEDISILENFAAAVIVIFGIIENLGDILHEFVKISVTTLLQLCLLIRWALRTKSDLYIIQSHWFGNDLVVITVNFFVWQFLKQS